ncbi:MAG: hypothetical protein ACU85V_00125 [Gammaproteobacteria bacterium]
MLHLSFDFEGVAGTELRERIGPAIRRAISVAKDHSGQAVLSHAADFQPIAHVFRDPRAGNVLVVEVNREADRDAVEAAARKAEAGIDERVMVRTEIVTDWNDI